MSDASESAADELLRLRGEVGDLQRQRSRDASEIQELRAAGDDAHRIEVAQRALIDRLRTEASDTTRELDAVADRLRAAERELVDLRAVRDALAPQAFAQRAGMAIAAEMTPAEPEVGGDFYYVGDGPGGTTVLAVGDVVGKGLGAARRAAFARTALASVSSFSDDPCQILSWVNVAMVERIGESADFVTAICASFDPVSRRVRVAAAGHHPALRLGTGEDLAATRTGAALGLGAELGCEPATATLSPGDGVLLFTDGVTEARRARAFYGTDRVRGILRRSAGDPPGAVIAAVVGDVQAFRDAPARDDVCLLALRAD